MGSSAWRAAIAVGLLAGAVIGPPLAPGLAREPALEIRFVGNAGVRLTDGVTTLLIDLPYEPGAFGYMRYDPDTLDPVGETVSVITHEHRDHFDRDLLDSGWRVIGGEAVTSGLPASRILVGDSTRVGAFSVIAVPTPHTATHRSYRVRWGGHTHFFAGDTEDVAAISDQPPLDILFITPWLSCIVERAGIHLERTRTILYHQAPDGSDAVCLGAVPMRQGETLSLPG